MGDKFPLTEARIVALFLESIFFGFYLITLERTVRCFIHKEDYWNKPLHFILAFATLALAAFVTLDVSVGLRQVLVAFVFSNTREAGADFLSDASNKDNLIRTICTPVLVLIADAMLVYRCFVIYYYNWWIIIAPLILWVGNVVCYGIAVYIAATLKQDAILNVESLKPFLTSGMVTSCVGSILSTGLISFRLYRFAKETAILKSARVVQRRTFADVIRIVIESGLMTTLANIMLIATYLAGNNADYPVSDVMNVIYAISFNLIIVRLDEKKPGESTISQQNGTSSRSAPIPLQFWDRRETQVVTNFSTNRPIEVMVTSESSPDSEYPTKEVDLK
ncbi:hypothetical protein ABKN59_003114 [Abortiporus biennis]